MEIPQAVTIFLIDPRDVKRLDRRFSPVRSEVRYPAPSWFRVWGDSRPLKKSGT